MPLTKRTVREERGAWSLLKKEAVRARATASSVVATLAPKLPAAVAGAPVFWKTARIFPPRSVTAITTGTSTATAAFCTIFCASAAVSRAAGGEGGDGMVTLRPPEHPVATKTTKRTLKNRLSEIGRAISWVSCGCGEHHRPQTTGVVYQLWLNFRQTIIAISDESEHVASGCYNHN